MAITVEIFKFYDYLYARIISFIVIFLVKTKVYQSTRPTGYKIGRRYILSAFDFDVVFTKQDKNAADFLSRIRVDETNNASFKCLSFIFDNCLFIINWMKIITQFCVNTMLSRVIRTISELFELLNYWRITIKREHCPSLKS